jgi:SAM-dependent methyltransferase
MLTNLLKRNRKVKRCALSFYNWFSQIFQTSPLNWPRLPYEILWYFRSNRNYRKLAGDNETIFSFPILFQRNSMVFDAQYTYQAVWATRHIINTKPVQHFDISSDIRFVTQLSAFLPTIYIEYRGVNQLNLENFQVRQGNIMNLPFGDATLNSISCLHVIEHIGLGRYGDPIDVAGPIKSLAELERVVAGYGSLYLSAPIGYPRTLFNAHRIFHPEYIPTKLNNLHLIEFSVVTTTGDFIQNTNPARYVDEEYACGLYWFQKI